MDEPVAPLARFSVNDIYRNRVNDVEPAGVRNTTSELDRLYLRTPSMLDTRMVQTGPNSKPDFRVRNPMQDGLSKLVDLNWNMVFRYQAAEKFDKEKMHGEH